MENAIFSKIDLSESTGISGLYRDAVQDLLDSPDVQKLCEHTQHMSTCRLQHSINVSYYSFRLARIFRVDDRAAARAGLLHDLYYYDFRNAELTCRQHSDLHPRIALQNARSVTSLSAAEEDIILTHMWPMAGSAPRNFEGYIVTFADKVCASLEVILRLLMRARTIGRSKLA